MKRRVVGLLLALAMATGVFSTTVVPAWAISAGSNGQHITYAWYNPSNGPSNWPQYVRVWGYNQNGKYWNGLAFTLGVCSGTPTCYSTDYSDWWVGSVSIYWYNSGNQNIDQTSCYVPKSQQGDYVTCWSDWWV